MTLRDLMESEGVEECAVESTSIYRMPIWRVPEHTVKLHLVNPYFIKQFPVKKNDVKVSRNLVKLDQCIQRRNIRISNYILTTDSKGYRSIVKLILQAIKDVSVLVEQPHGRNNLTYLFCSCSLNGSSTVCVSIFPINRGKTLFLPHKNSHCLGFLRKKLRKIFKMADIHHIY